MWCTCGVALTPKCLHTSIISINFLQCVTLVHVFLVLPSSLSWHKPDTRFSIPCEKPLLVVFPFWHDEADSILKALVNVINSYPRVTMKSLRVHLPQLTMRQAEFWFERIMIFFFWIQFENVFMRNQGHTLQKIDWNYRCV